jgi:hypothetical protein
MMSALVPTGYVLANTYETSGTLEETREIVERSIKDVFTPSPDRLFYICRQLYDHALFTFHIKLFHSEKGEFIEIRYFGKMRTTFHEIELQFIQSCGFTPSKGNKVPREIVYIPYETVTDMSDEIDNAICLTETDCSYKELISGIRICVDVLKLDVFSIYRGNLSVGFILIERLCNLILTAPEYELRCLAIDALAGHDHALILATRIHALKDNDALVRFHAMT